jgi:transcriptional regulator with XRE-family HTH domain
MVNIARVRAIAKEKGIKIGYICDQLGMKNSYLADVANGKNSMSDERITKIAEILGTTHAYLTDETDDPAPVIGEPMTKSEIEMIQDMTIDLLKQLDEPDLKAVLAFLRAKQQTP